MSKPISDQPILLIGATGLIGSTLGSLLTGRGYPVRVLLRNSEDQSRLKFTPNKVYVGDLCNQDTLNKAVSGTKFVLHFASTSVPAESPFDPAKEISQTLPSLHALLRAISASGAHLIFPSSGGAVYGNTAMPANESTTLKPTSSYALGKVLSEEIIRFYAALGQIKFTILRFSNIYGSATPRKRLQGIIDNFLLDAKMQRVSSVWGNTKTVRDFLHVHDAGSAVLEILNNPSNAVNEVFNLGSGQASTIQNVLDMIHDVTDGQHQYQLIQNQYAGPQSSLIDTTKFKTAYPNWQASLNLRQGIERTWELANHPAHTHLQT